MLPATPSPQRVDEILIQVSDLDRALRFYRDGLGIPFQPTGLGDGAFEGKVGEVRLVLHPEWDPALRQAPRGAGVLLHLWVADVDAYRDAIARRGVSIAEEPEDRPWGRHLAVIDPDGYRIHILGPVGSQRPSPPSP